MPVRLTGSSQSSNTNEPSTPDLLAILEAIVSKDRSPAGFSGKLCVGIVGDSGPRYWCASFGSTVESELPTDPWNVAWDVVCVLGEEEIRNILVGSYLPGGPAVETIEGDPVLWAKFARRYLHREAIAEARNALSERPKKAPAAEARTPTPRPPRLQSVTYPPIALRPKRPGS